MTLFLFLFSVWIGFLVAEAIRLRRWREKVPLRITVTGTRGKTSLVRMVASVLREDGRRVVAKTTGSQARIIPPDGGEIPVRRRGVPSILEQIRLLRFAVRERAQVVVAEIMSVHRENHAVESRRILRPHLILMTNFRVDHTEASGWTRGDVAALHLADVVPGSTVLVPAGEVVPGFAEAVAARGAALVPVPQPDPDPRHTGALPSVVGDNLALVRALGRFLSVDEAVVTRGLARTRGDAGAHWIRRYQGREGESALTVNAFAANDPFSTGLLMEWARCVVPEGTGPLEVIGLLNLRADRGDRTVQWLSAMQEGFSGQFSRLYVAGFHGPAFCRGLRRRGLGSEVHLLRDTNPERAMARILAGVDSGEPLVFGFGNFHGLGEALVEHWLERSGKMGDADTPFVGGLAPGPGTGGLHGA